MQSQVRFNSRKPWWSGSTGSGEGCREGPEKVLESLAQGQVRFNRVSSAWLRSTLQRFVKMKSAAVGDTTEAYFPNNVS